MGRAIVREPSVFLMDEPLSNLDAKLRVETRANIAALQQRLGTTTVYVTHDQVEAMTMGHRVAVLKDGVLQQVDTPRNLYDRPANAFVAGFIGSPAMNIRTVAVVPGGARLGRPDHRAARGQHGRGPQRRAGRRCMLGLRPECFEVSSETAGPQDRGAARRGARRRRVHLRLDRGRRRADAPSRSSCGSTAGCRPASATSSA